jgi:uncharacterized repeat protein (TIGR01451 family)
MCRVTARSAAVVVFLSIVAAMEPPPVAATPVADLAITEVADRADVAIGAHITFTLTVTNLGPDVATGILFGDPLPDPLNLVSFSTSAGSIETGSYCSVEALPPGASVTAVLVATPIVNPAPEERWFENTAYIATSTSYDPDPANDMAAVQSHIVDVPSAVDFDDGTRMGLTTSLEAGSEIVRVVFSLPAPSNADLAVFDVRGRCIERLARGEFAAGPHLAEWRPSAGAAPVSRGVYLIRLQTPAGGMTRKVRLNR